MFYYALNETKNLTPQDYIVKTQIDNITLYTKLVFETPENKDSMKVNESPNDSRTSKQTKALNIQARFTFPTPEKFENPDFFLPLDLPATLNMTKHSSQPGKFEVLVRTENILKRSFPKMMTS